MTGLDLAFRYVVQAGFSRELFGAECDEIALVPHPLDRCRLCGDGLTICGEDCRGRAEIAQQSCCPIWKGNRLSGVFGGCDQDRAAVVGERNTRAQTDESCANARPKATQPLKPRSAAMRERARQASDLNGCRVTCVETQQCRLAGRGRVEDRRACRVGPKDAIGIRAPQPYRRRSERMRREPRVTENCKLRRRVRHLGVATITANKDLIRLPVVCVHASAGAIQRQAPVALT